MSSPRSRNVHAYGDMQPCDRGKGVGAGDEVRTRDMQLGRLPLCQLSYSRSDGGVRQQSTARFADLPRPVRGGAAVGRAAQGGTGRGDAGWWLSANDIGPKHPSCPFRGGMGGRRPPPGRVGRVRQPVDPDSLAVGHHQGYGRRRCGGAPWWSGGCCEPPRPDGEERKLPIRRVDPLREHAAMLYHEIAIQLQGMRPGRPSGLQPTCRSVPTGVPARRRIARSGHARGVSWTS
jgi:hypothetical protein